MKIEDVKQWQCGNGLAVAVNPYSQKSKVFNRFGGFDGIPNSQIWEEFEDWRNDPANQPVTDLSGIYNSEQVKEVWEYFDNEDSVWREANNYHINTVANDNPIFEKFSEYYHTTRRRLVPVEAALCNTDSSVKEGKPITDISKLQAQFDNQMKHKESIKQYWLSCSESKNKWVEAIKEYFDGAHNEITTFEEFKYQFDLD